ncbi:hypothetical protein [Kitasatospora sp. NPDC094011]|uniref:hypothetical protein n=1 Tax=Kitasatospora sp. NPDC094011 TaxID=3364090 RepID=UPI003801AD92
MQAPLTHHGGGLRNSTSGNWSGYAATGSKFTSVNASWVQPSVSFTGAGANGRSLGGFTPDAITMASGGVTRAATSGLSGGSSFSVTWKHS